MNNLIALIAFSALLLAPMISQNVFATVYSCTADMSGANEVGPIISPAFGTFTGSYDDVTNQLNWDISWADLLGDESLLFIHGPALPDQNAGVQLNIGAISGLVAPSIGNSLILPAQENDLLADLWYINLHTDVFPAGEIRGQISCNIDNVIGGKMIPVDSAVLLLVGIQVNLLWFAPVILAGAGFVAYKLRRNSCF